MKSILSESKKVFNATNSNAIISKEKNIFWIFKLRVRNLHKILNTFRKIMTLRGDFFLKL